MDGGSIIEVDELMCSDWPMYILREMAKRRRFLQVLFKLFEKESRGKTSSMKYQFCAGPLEPEAGDNGLCLERKERI